MYYRAQRQERIVQAGNGWTDRSSSVSHWWLCQEADYS